MFDFEILFIDENNNAESCCYFDKPKDKEFILNTFCNDVTGLEGSRFNNDFVLALLVNHLITDKIEQDIYAGRFKIGCYAYDDLGNMYKRLLISQHDLPNPYIRQHSKHWSD